MCSLTCALVTCRSCSSPRRRWKALQAYQHAWVGAFLVELRLPTSTSTSASVHRGTGPRGRGAQGGAGLLQSSATGPETGTGLPPIVEQNARSSGTDLRRLTESRASAPSCATTAPNATTYSTTWRGLEFVMGYYPILDHAPKGRDEVRRGSSGSAGTTSTRRVTRRLGQSAPRYDNCRQSRSHGRKPHRAKDRCDGSNPVLLRCDAGRVHRRGRLTRSTGSTSRTEGHYEVTARSRSRCSTTTSTPGSRRWSSAR